MPLTELTNMVMVQDTVSGKVLVQNRIKSWRGLSFPGGHVEYGESFVESAVREVKEETGLDIRNLKSCGVIHWYNKKTFDRYLVFLYRTTDFTGELVSETCEGKNSWMTIQELVDTPSENDIHKYLPMFLEGKYLEAYGPWTENEPVELIIY